MGSRKSLMEKLRLISAAKRRAPRWCDIKKFGLKRARTRRIISYVKNWRRGKYKI